MVFKKIDTRSLKVLVFDHDNCEKVIKCKGNHAPYCGEIPILVKSNEKLSSVVHISHTFVWVLRG